MDTEVLNELGFTDREIKVYVALLELGSSKAGPISARSGLAHTKVYETLDRLIQKGLVTYVVVSKTKFFEAADPREIMQLMEERKSRFKELLDELMEKRRFAKERQVSIVHEGYKAVRAVFRRVEEELGKDDIYRVFALKETYKQPTAISFLRPFHERLEKKGVDDRILAHRDVKNEVREMYRDIKSMRIRFVKRSMPMGVMIFKDKVVQIIWGERPTAIEIVSRQIFEQYKNFFDEVWEDSEK